MDINTNIKEEIEKELQEFTNILVSQQVPPDPKLDKIIVDNLWELYDHSYPSKCKYSLRHHLQSLKEYLQLIEFTGFYNNKDYYQYVRITNEVRRRISCIKEYLNIDKENVSKKSYGEIFDDTKRWLKDE